MNHQHRPKSRAARPQPASKTKSTELVRLAAKLRARGATVIVTKEKVAQPFFAVKAKIININGEAVQVFEYASLSLADADAKRVSSDGNTIGTSKPNWMAAPHFFKSTKLIVLYLGGNQTILNVLQAALGSQFAGAK